MAARIGLNGSQCITPVLFSMEMERALGPINMVPMGFNRGAIEFAGISAGRPPRQPIVRIDGHKSYVEHIYRSAMQGKEVEGSAFLDQVRGLDSYMDVKVDLPPGMILGRIEAPQQPTIRELAALVRKCKKLHVPDVPEDLVKGLVMSKNMDDDELNRAMDNFNFGVLRAALGSPESKSNAGERFLRSAEILRDQKLDVRSAIAAEYALEMFNGMGDPKRVWEAGKLAVDAWLLSAKKFENIDQSGFLIAIRYGLLCAMKSENTAGVEKFHDRAANFYRQKGDFLSASDYHVRAAVSVLQNTEWIAEDWGQVKHQLHRTRGALEKLHPLKVQSMKAGIKARIKAVAGLSKITETMAGR